MRKVNWEKIKTEYITTKISTRALAEKHNVSYMVVAKRCRAEKWVEERKKHNRKVVAKAVQKVESPKARVLADEIAAMDMLGKAVVQCLSDPDQFRRWVGQESMIDGDMQTRTLEEKIFDKFDTRAMKDLAYTLNTVSNLKRDLNGMLQEKDRIMIELAKQKLELEKLRMELDQKKADEQHNKEITVVLEGDLKEWAV